MHDSGAVRQAMLNSIAEVRGHVKELQDAQEKDDYHTIKMWQYLFGLTPNGWIEKIVPTADSWCGGITAGIKSINRTLWALGGLIVVNGFTSHASKQSLEAFWTFIKAMMGAA